MNAPLIDTAAHWLGSTVRQDGWENHLTGFGTHRDKTRATHYGAFFQLGDAEIDSIYHGDAIAARMVDTVPEEQLRQGYFLGFGAEAKKDEDPNKARIGVDADDGAELADDIDDVLTVHSAIEKIVEADIWGRTYGGSAIVLGADDGLPAWKPLDMGRIKTLDFLQVIDRRYLFPETFYQSGPKTGEPEIYMLGNVNNVINSPFRIHESRLIIFRGARTSLQERRRRNWWDQSFLQRPYDAMTAFATGYKGVQILLTDGPQGVYKLKGLSSLIGAQGLQKLNARLETIEMFRSVLRAIVVDADNESFERQQVSMSGYDTVLDRFALLLAASVDMPVTLLMGQSPAGMNATGDADFRKFYDKIKGRQRTYLSPRLRRLIEVLCAAKDGPTNGEGIPKVKIEFAQLWSLNPKEEGERRLSIAQADQIYFNMGGITPEEIMLSRIDRRGQFRDDYTAFDHKLREEALELKEDEIVNGPPEPAHTVVDQNGKPVNGGAPGASGNTGGAKPTNGKPPSAGARPAPKPSRPQP